MSSVVQLSATAEFGLVLYELAFHPEWLPLGGNQAAQIALCLGTAYVIDEFIRILGHEGEARGECGRFSPNGDREQQADLYKEPRGSVCLSCPPLFVFQGSMVSIET